MEQVKMEGKMMESPRKEEPKKKRRFQPMRLDYNQMMAEFNACAIRPKTLPAPEQRKERMKLERFTFKPSDFEDSPPKRSKVRQSKPAVPNKARSSGAVNYRRTTNIKAHWNVDKEKPKLVTQVLNQAKAQRKFTLSNPMKAANMIKVAKMQANKASVLKQSAQKEKIKLSQLLMESKKLDLSTNTPDWTVAEVCSKEKGLPPSPELSPTECEFLEIEKSLKMKDEMVGTDVLNLEIKINKILEEDRNEIFKFQKKVETIVNEFVIAQDQRNEKVMQILTTMKKSSKPSLYLTPLRDITANVNRKSRLYSHSDGKVLKKTTQLHEDKVMDKALNLYNSMRNISKSILATPKLNRSSLQTPKSIKQSQGVSISKIIQKQCLMLHETPYKN